MRRGASSKAAELRVRFKALRAFKAPMVRFKRLYVPFKVLSLANYESGIVELKAKLELLELRARSQTRN